MGAPSPSGAPGGSTSPLRVASRTGEVTPAQPTAASISAPRPRRRNVSCWSRRRGVVDVCGCDGAERAADGIRCINAVVRKLASVYGSAARGWSEFWLLERLVSRRSESALKRASARWRSLHSDLSRSGSTRSSVSELASPRGRAAPVRSGGIPGSGPRFGVSGPVETGPAEGAGNFGRSAAVHHFCSGQTCDVCYYPPPVSEGPFLRSIPVSPTPTRLLGRARTRA